MSLPPLIDHYGNDKSNEITEALLAAPTATRENPFLTFEDATGVLPIETSDVTGLDTALATIPADASELTVSPAVAGESDVQGALEALARKAAFVEPTTATPEDIANALIDCGLMAPSGSGTPGIAAFVEPTTATPEAIANALIVAGLMEAS